MRKLIGKGQTFDEIIKKKYGKKKFNKGDYTLAQLKVIELYRKHKSKLTQDERVLYESMIDKQAPQLKMILLRKFGA